jgi:phosphocarrier protein HPr
MLADESKEQTASGSFIVENDKGLHTRPSTELVKCAILFESEVFLSKSGQKVSAKSLLGILTLAASKGTKIEIEAKGADAEKAVEAIESLAQKKFHMHY